MSGQRFDFVGARGTPLSGRIESPLTAPRGWAIFAHCFTCGRDSLAATRISKALVLSGIGVLRFDFAGLGGSGGEFAASTFATDVDDLIAAGRAMAKAGHAPTLLIGHSLGGAAALSAAADMPSVRAVATVGAPSQVKHVLRQIDAASLQRIEQDGEAELLLAGRPFKIRKSFVDDARQQDLQERIGRMRKPLLVMHAPGDTVVDIGNATEIFLAARHPRSFVSLDDADHLLTRRADAEYAASVIAAWAARYLPTLAASIPDVAQGEGVLAEETGGGAFQLAISSGKHRFLADEPGALGGKASGPAPYDLVSAGLAACTVMTMRMYARHKGLPLVRASARVTHSRHAEQTPADLFTRAITLEGPLDEEQRNKLLAIADRCPVDLTLSRGSEVSTHLEQSGDHPSRVTPGIAAAVNVARHVVDAPAAGLGSAQDRSDVVDIAG
ncbi:bifunctional alpha/beta hydrolase/OsmC family protein [Xanthomonas melonis]|uniref:bifunctional alpha/beta hydrolase/OsmC family protein n=1 Tax=Xanthomonas melonis TaxID=56456 RepID=UPI001E5C31E7|nr:bifunctional alpha/beta hydrolase/OsmC family protein [Xanthomonas melonis]